LGWIRALASSISSLRISREKNYKSGGGIRGLLENDSVKIFRAQKRAQEIESSTADK